MTSTLTSIVIALTNAARHTTHRLDFATKRLLMFVTFALGAVTGGLLTAYGTDAIPFVPLGAALAALVVRTASSGRGSGGS